MAKTVLDKFTNQFLLHDHVSLRGDTMTGALTITPSADSVSIFIVNKADATPVLTVDTSGSNVITGGYTYLGGTSSTGLRIKGTDTTNTIWQPNSGSTLAIAANGGSITLGQTSDPDFTLGSTGLITTTNSIGIGAVPPGNQRLNIAGTQTGSDNAFGVYMGALTLSPANTYGAYFQYVGGGFVATGASNTIALAVGLYAEAIQKTGTGTITNTYGLYVNPSTTGSNNYGAYIGGNVGIGTESPLTKLSFGTTLEDKIYLYQGATAAGSVGFGTSSGQMTLFTDSTGTDFRFKYGGSAGTDIFTIKGGGKVGIGTTSPNQLLELNKGFLRFSYETAPGAPTVAVNVTAGNLNGAYSYQITFVTAEGETEAGTTSSTVNPATQQVDLSAIPTGTSGKVTSRKIYRTAAGGTTYKLVTTISDNTTTTYTDNIADGSLGATAPTNNTTSGKIYAGTTRSMHITHNGRVGIGTDASVSQMLTINETKTSATAFTPAFRVEVFSNPSASSSATTIGAWYRVFIASGNAQTHTGSIIGQLNESVHAGTGTLSNAYGGQFSTKVDNSGNLNVAVGGYFGLGKGGSGTGQLQTVIMVWASSPAAGLTMTRSKGVQVDNQGHAGVTDAYGVWVAAQSGAVTSNYAIYTNAGDIRLMASDTDKLGLFGATPVVRQNHIVDADGTLADITTKFNTLLSQLESYGLLKTS